MKLRRLYSNQPSIFAPIEFNQGLSAVLAEIRVPGNQMLDTHNLGKTTVGELIDFCLLKGKSSSFFLFKHADRFAEFTFFLEVQLADDAYLTIARPVDPGSKVSFLRSDLPVDDAALTDTADWDHVGLAFNRAKTLLNGILGFERLQPWPFRKLVGYLIRSQRDYLDVFQLGKFSGKHQDWKPFVAHLLGLRAQPVIELYAKREELSAAENRLSELTREWGGEDVDVSLIDGLIAVKRREVDAKTKVLESFKFGEEDRRRTVEVVEQTEAEISSLNEEVYRLTQLITRIEESLGEQQVLFKPAEAERLFADAGIAFGEQIKRDYEQLIAFNHAITAERSEALLVQQRQATARVDVITSDLKKLNQSRTESLEFLRESDSLAKFRDLSREVSGDEAELATLDARRNAASRLMELRREKRELSEECGRLITTVEAEIEAVSKDESSRFAQLRRFFTEIVHEVLGQDAVLAIRMNNAGGLDFTAEFIGDSGTATSGDHGTSYKKLLCIAFDLALLRSNLDVPFPRFVYHDGALEQLEPRKRERLIGVFRNYADLGIQPIISLLNTDLPSPVGASADTLMMDEVVSLLHDEGDDGRLFRMPPW